MSISEIDIYMYVCTDVIIGLFGVSAAFRI